MNENFETKKHQKGNKMKKIKILALSLTALLALNACESSQQITDINLSKELSSQNSSKERLETPQEDFALLAPAKIEAKILSKEQIAQKIIAFYQAKIKNPNLHIHFVDFIPANEKQEFDAYIFEFNLQGQSQRELVFADNELIFNDYANLNTLQSGKELATQILQNQSKAKILQALREDRDYIITLGRGKKEVYVFSDPLCPYCKKHLAGIDENYLKKHTLHFIFISVHQRQGFERANLIYEKLQKAKNDKERLTLIKHYYENNTNELPSNEAQTLNLQRLFEKYAKLGVNYVPYIIEK